MSVLPALQRMGPRKQPQQARAMQMLMLLLLATILPSAYCSKHKSEHHQKKSHTSSETKSSKTKHSHEERDNKYDDTKHPSTVVLLMQVQERNGVEGRINHFDGNTFGGQDYVNPSLEAELSHQAARLLGGRIADSVELAVASDEAHYHTVDETDGSQQAQSFTFDIREAAREEEHPVGKVFLGNIEKGKNLDSSKLTVYSMADVRDKESVLSTYDDEVEMIDEEGSDTEDTSFALREGSALWSAMHQIRAHTNTTFRVENGNVTSLSATKETERRKRWVHCYVGDSLVRMMGQTHAQLLNKYRPRVNAHFAPKEFDKAHADYSIYRDDDLHLRMLWRPHIKNLLNTSVSGCHTVVWNNFGHEVRDNTKAFFSPQQRLQAFEEVFQHLESQLALLDHRREEISLEGKKYSNKPRVMMYAPHYPRFSFARERNENITMMDAFMIDQPLFDKLEGDHVVLRTDLLSSPESPLSRFISHGRCCGHLSTQVLVRFYHIYEQLFNLREAR